MKEHRTVIAWLGFLAVLLAIGFMCKPAHADNVWQAASFSVGAQEKWLDKGSDHATRDFEGTFNAALSVTPHVSVTAGLAYIFGNSNVRGQVDASLCSTDVNDPDFNAWVGVGRYFSKHPEDGLDEMAGKAGLGWRPVHGSTDVAGVYHPSPWVLGLTIASGLDTARQYIGVSGSYAFKIPGR